MCGGDEEYIGGLWDMSGGVGVCGGDEVVCVGLHCYSTS